MVRNFSSFCRMFVCHEQLRRMTCLRRLLILFCLVPSLSAADGISDIFPRIIKRIVARGLSSFRSTTIAHSEFDPSQAPGEVVSNVNIFNGQPYYSIPLATINARGVLSWQLSLSYYGGVQPMLQSSNQVAPSGPYGFGWNMSAPYVHSPCILNSISRNDIRWIFKRKNSAV